MTNVLRCFGKRNAAFTLLGDILKGLLAVLLNTFIDWKSYVYSAVLTLSFAFIMQIMMNRKLRRINMAKSLKTVE